MARSAVRSRWTFGTCRSRRSCEPCARASAAGGTSTTACWWLIATRAHRRRIRTIPSRTSTVKDVFEDVPVDIRWNDAPFDAAIKVFARMLSAEPAVDATLSSKRISMSLTKQSVNSALNALCRQAGCRWRLAESPARVLRVIEAPPAKPQVAAASAAPFTGTARVGDPGVTAPRLLSAVHPRYTGEAMRAGIQGVAIVECVVGTDGTVGDARIVKSLDQTFGLDAEALAAARLYVFAPGGRGREARSGRRLAGVVLHAAVARLGFRCHARSVASTRSSMLGVNTLSASRRRARRAARLPPPQTSAARAYRTPRDPVSRLPCARASHRCRACHVPRQTPARSPRAAGADARSRRADETRSCRGDVARPCGVGRDDRNAHERLAVVAAPRDAARRFLPLAEAHERVAAAVAECHQRARRARPVPPISHFASGVNAPSGDEWGRYRPPANGAK